MASWHKKLNFWRKPNVPFKQKYGLFFCDFLNNTILLWGLGDFRVKKTSENVHLVKTLKRLGHIGYFRF